MRRLLPLFVFLCAASALAVEGTWNATLIEDRDHLHLQFVTGHANLALPMTLAAFETLTPSQIKAPASPPVSFVLRRDAGTIRFEGTFRNGRGTGQFTFTPNPAFIDSVRAMGVTALRTSDEFLFGLAVHDVSTGYIRAMRDAGFTTTLQKYLAMRILNVTPEYARAMESVAR